MPSSSGTGNDFIYLDEDSTALVKYTSGNDTISGFNANDTLQLSNYSGSYSTQISGDDVIVNVNTGQIALLGVASLNTINITLAPEIRNEQSGIVLTGTSYADSIYNSGYSATINTGDGNDSIYNDGSYFNGVTNHDGGDSVKFDTGAGDDYINNYYGDNPTINAGNGNDSVHNIYGVYASIDMGNGNDSVYNFGHDSTINGGDGNDTIKNMIQNVSINAGDGNNYISNQGDKTTILTGKGNDNIFNSGSNVTINAGTGDDSISIHSSSENNLILYSPGEGNDSIVGFNETSTLRIGDGTETYSSIKSGDNILVMVNKNKIILKGAASLPIINIEGKQIPVVVNPLDIIGTEDDDTISNDLDGATVQALGGNDSIYNSGHDSTINAGNGNDTIKNWVWVQNVSINAGDGDDEIDNYSSTVTIKGGTGKDSISNYYSSSVMISGDDGDDYIYNYMKGANVTIDAGDDNDTISNTGSYASILGGYGNDSIYNQEHGTLVTLDGGNGDDTIRNNNAENLLLTYTEGDGNDYVTGFNTTSTLRIGGGNGSYSSQTSGSDIIVTVGEGSITLKDAANLSTVNIQGEEEVIGPTWTLNGTTATYGTNSETLLTITGVKSLSGISLNNKIVTVSNVALNQGTVTVSDGYTLKLANDVTIPTKTKAGWSPVSSSKATYNFESTTAGYTLTDNKINYTKATTAESFYLSGIKSTNGISVEGTTVTLNAANLDKKAVTISNGYKLALNNDVTASKKITAGWTNSNGSFIYTEAGTTEGYNLDANSVTYHTKTGGEQFTITGVRDTKNISVKDKIVTISNAALNGSTVFLTGKDYTLALAPDVPQSTTENPGSFTKLSSGKATFLTNSSGDFYILSDNKIYYKAASSGKSITITGLKKTLTLKNGAIDGITSTYSNGVTTFKIKESALTSDDVTLTGDNCKLELDGYTKPAEVPVTFVNGVYTQAYTPAFYSATDKKISYNGQVGGGKFTISGLKNDASVGNGIQISGKNVTLSQSVLNGENVTLTTSDGYKLAIDKSVPTYSTKINATWSNIGDAYTYTAACTSDYYKLGGNKLTYIKAKGSEQFTISGVNSSSGIKVSGKNVTISKAALGDKNVIFSTSDGYKLAFDKNVPTAKEIKQTWISKRGTFTYTAAGTTAGYSLNGNTIVYNEQVGGEQFTISGLKDTKAVSVSGKVVTVGKTSLNSKVAELTGDYTLALGGDVPTSAAQVAGSFTAFAKGTATFKTSHYANDFYTLDGNKITYTPIGGNEIKISNLNTNATLADINATIDISEQSDGSFKITFKNGNVLSTKAPAVSVPKGISYTVAVDDALAVAEETPVWKVSGTNATFRTDTSATYAVSKNKVVYTKPKTGATQISLAGLAKNAILDLPQEKVLTLDASVFSKKTSLKTNSGGYSVKLTGNMTGKTFVGSSGADTLNIVATNASIDGSAGNDLITVNSDNVTVTGGKGNDNITLTKATTLIYGSGQGNDTVNFIDGIVISETSDIKDAVKNGSELVLGFGKNSSLTITGVDDNDELPIDGKKRNLTVDMSRFTLGNILTFDKTKSPTAVTVGSAFKGSISQSDDLYLGGAKLSNVTTFDASKVTSKISIEGNSKANTIIGGQGQSELIGGKGNDLFVFNGSELTIADYGNGSDKIDLNGYEIAKITVDEISFDKSRDLTISLKSGSKSGILTIIDGAKNSKGNDVKISIVDGKKAPAYIFETDKIFNSGRTSVTVKGSDADFSNDKKLKIITADEDFSGSVVLGNSGANTIYGNSSANSLEGGKGNDILHGGAGKDSLWGGVGNDILYGDSGSDSFIYNNGEGKDVIFGFENNDVLQITGDWSASFNAKKNEIAFKVGTTSNAITLRDFDASTFNINGDSYAISGTKLVKK